MTKQDKIFSFMLEYTTRNMRRYAADVFAEQQLGITLDQWGVLMLLSDSKPGLNNSELAERMAKDPPTVSRIVDVLVREESVVRERDLRDRRLQRIKLTAKGRAIAKRAEPVVEKLRKQVGSGLTAAQRRSLIECLEKLNGRIEELRGSL